jgi:hypothetical protein
MASRHLAGSVGVNERSPIRGEPPEDSAAHRFGSLIRDRSAELGVEVVIAYEAWSASGGYIIQVNGAVDLLFEIDDWVEGARVMDPHGEDVSVAEAIDYFADRAVGSQRCRRVVWLSTSS